MKRIFKLILTLVILIGVLNFGISLDLYGNGKIVDIGVDAYATASTMTVDFPSSTTQSRSQTVTINNLYSVTSMSVDNGNVAYNTNGNSVSILVWGGTAHLSARTCTYAYTRSDTNFPSTYSYNDGTYSGSIPKSGSYTSTVVSGSPAGSKTASGTKYGYNWWVYTYHASTGWTITSQTGTDYPAISYGPDSEGYSGTLSKTSAPLVGDTGAPSGTASEGATYTRTKTYQGNYSGTVTKTDTRVWSYTQNYSGIVYTPSYYRYTVTVYYVTEIPPTITVMSPGQNTIFSAQATKNTLPLAGTIYDPDIGDIETIYYRIDGTAGQAGTQYGNTITSNNSNQPFPSPSQTISISAVGEGTHTLYVWVQDNKGGKSAETAISFKMDKSVPTVTSAPTLTANSASQITIQGNATEPTVAGVSSGLNSSTPYIYYRGTTALGTWRSGNCVDTGLSPNTQYTYKYQARDNVLNTSGYSATASKYTLAATPSITVTNPTSYTLDVVTSDTNPSNTQYKIWTTTGGPTKYVSSTGALVDTVQWITLTGKKITVTGLTSNLGYNFCAHSRNSDNVENTTDSSGSNTTLVAPPGKPINLRVTSSTVNTIAIAWDAVSGATGYDVEVDNSGTWVNNNNVTTFAHGTLASSSTHTYRVRAKNGGNPSIGTPSDPLTAYTMPGIPGGFTVTPASANTINVSWSAVAGATGYDIYVDSGPNPTGNGTSTTFSHSSLGQNSQHSYKVRAKYNSTNGDYTASISKYTLANKPASGSITSISNNSISASWGANNNPANTEYSLAVFNSSNVFIKQNAWTTNLYDTMTGLDSKTTYILKVKARNRDNIDPNDWFTITSGTSTNPNKPLLPIGLTATVNSKSSITLTWNPSEDAASYDILRNGSTTITNVTSPFTDTGLASETTYTYQIRANNVTGSSDYCTGVTATTQPDPPGIPGGLSLSSTTTSITLTWDTVTKATGYKVEVDGGARIIDTGNATSCTDSGLGKGSQHSYRVLAYNTGGDGVYTSTYSASTLLDTPEDVTASSTNSRLLVKWSEVQNASSYEVSVGEYVYSTLGTSYTYENLNPSTSYTYKVRAVNGVSTSTWSDERTKTTLCNPPDMPGNISSSVSKTTVTLIWDAVAGATGYDVMADGQLFTDTKGTSFVQTGLAPGTEHILKVRARNAGGKSAWSSDVIQSTLPSSPNVPSNLTASASSSTIAVQWDTVADADGYEIETDSTDIEAVSVAEYVYQGAVPGSTHTFRVRTIKQETPGEWSESLTVMTRSNDFGVPANINATPDATSINLTWDTVSSATGYEIEVDGIVIIDNGTSTDYTQIGLEPETRHTYRVRTQNSGVAGDWSDVISCVTMAGMLQTPDNFGAKVYEDRIVLSWNPVLEASSYELVVDDSSTQNVTDSVYGHEGLDPLTQHTYKIRSVNENGCSDWSELLTVSTLSNIPTPPGNIDLTSTDNSIKISWDMVEGADSYDVETDGTIIENVIDTQYLHTGLDAASTHTYRVRAINEANIGDWSELETKVTLPNKPSTPGNIVVTPSSSEITTVWGSVYGAEGYDINFDGIVIDNGASTTYTKTGLDAGTQHSIRVRAKNAGGAGNWSSQITILTLAEAPGVPDGITTSSDSNSITINWNELPGTLAYEIEADEVVVNVGLNTQYVDYGLISGSLHAYRVRAVNEGGPGDWSAVIATGTKLAIPAGLSAATGEDTILLSWNTVEGSNEYDIEIDGVLAASINTASYTHENVISNQEHTYRIRAKNAVNISDWSSPLTSKIPAQVYTGTFTTGDEFYFELDANNVSNIENARFTITYDPSLLDVVDLYAGTDNIDLEPGDINDSNIRVIQLSSGKIVLAIRENGLSGEYTGLVDIILFKAKTDGEVSITYSIN